ncbi:MAG: PAS-domain containing protein [Pseudomonadota bacterium]|nr:PAS-domain containing protein [Pseudomonadota bacterium]
MRGGAPDPRPGPAAEPAPAPEAAAEEETDAAALWLTDPSEPPERQAAKLRRIAAALMRRVELSASPDGAAYAQFQRALTLEEEVRARTTELEQTLALLNETNARLGLARAATDKARADLANAIEAVQEGFALFDAEDRLVMFNARFGLGMPDIRRALRPGLSFSDYVDAISRSPHLSLPPGEPPAAWADTRLRRHREPQSSFNVRLAGDRWIQVNEYRTPDGGSAILQTDVTDMIRLERAERERLLDDQARLIRATLDHINQGICIFDARGLLVGWNRRLRELLGPPAHTLRIGRSFATLYERFALDLAWAPGAERRLIDWVARGRGRPALRAEVRHRGLTTLDVFAQEMPDAGFVISFTDVTAERAAVAAIRRANETLEARVEERTLALADALAEAERANASKSRFVAAASHDLLQPLSAAKLFLASLSAMDLDDGPRQVAGRAANALNSVEGILASLLDISRLDSGQAAVERSVFPVNRILRPLREEFEPLARARGLELRVMDCAAHVDSDPSHLRRVLQNLIANAVRYTERGRVLVGARRRGDGLRLEVWDTGPGIEPDKREVIFKEFQRLDRPGRMSEGVGLGLAIVERACALLGHRLELVSEPGRGAGFLLTLPRAAARGCEPGGEGRGEARAAPVAPARALDEMIALVVENDRELRHAMTTLLESWNVSCFDVGSEFEAMALLDEVGVAPDVALVDYHLDDGRNGLDCIARLRGRYGWIPAAIMSADRSPGLRAACLAAGLAYLEKPVDPERLGLLLASAAPGR